MHLTETINRNDRVEVLVPVFLIVHVSSTGTRCWRILKIHRSQPLGSAVYIIPGTTHSLEEGRGETQCKVLLMTSFGEKHCGSTVQLRDMRTSKYFSNSFSSGGERVALHVRVQRTHSLEMENAFTKIRHCYFCFCFEYISSFLSSHWTKETKTVFSRLPATQVTFESNITMPEDCCQATTVVSLWIDFCM